MNKVTIQYRDSVVEYECSYALARAINIIMNHMQTYKKEEKCRIYFDEFVGQKGEENE